MPNTVSGASLMGRDAPDANGDEFKSWFPDDKYHSNHANRLRYSFDRLPSLPRGFSCLIVGSWGTEAPLLANAFGASRIVCIRAPEQGLAAVETKSVTAPNGASTEIELHCLDAERSDVPIALGKFDLVLAWEVLEHLNYDPAWMVWQAVRSLKNGGFISLTTPNALWHYYTTAQIFGSNALGLRLQHHIPFATHWRLYSPNEVADLVENMGCSPQLLTSFLRDMPFSLKSRIYLRALEFMRRRSGNGNCSFGQHIYLLAKKHSDTEIYRPTWLYPQT